jgi:DNA-binding transcriptional MerR regulator
MSDGLPQKLYFRIGEVAGIVGVEPHVLRYWEREFRSIRPTKSARGQRVYSRRDVENLLRVRELLYTQGFTIAGARKQLQRPAREDAEAHVSGEASTGNNKPPIVAAPPEDPSDPGREPHEDTLRGTLVALRDEVSAFLDELA